VLFDLVFRFSAWPPESVLDKPALERYREKAPLSDSRRQGSTQLLVLNQRSNSGCTCRRGPQEGSTSFREADFWQHPRTFEKLCKGDCEHHALWAWRKLVELGHRAEFFVGQWFEGGGGVRDQHAWVVFEQNGQLYVLESVIEDNTLMVSPLTDIRTQYRPHFSVDAAFTMRAHAGYLAVSEGPRATSRERAARQAVADERGLSTLLPIHGSKRSQLVVTQP